MLLPALLLPLFCLGADSTGNEASAESKPLSIEVGRVAVGRSGNWAEVNIEMLVSTPGVVTVAAEGLAAKGIVVKPLSRTLEITTPGRVAAGFRIYHQRGDWQRAGNISFVAELVAEGRRWQDRAAVIWPVNLGHNRLFHAPRWWFIAILTGILAAAGYCSRSRAQDARTNGAHRGRLLCDLSVLLFVELFIIWHLSPEFLITSTTTTGGDTASHFYTLAYLKQVLLPGGQVSGWTPGNYAGFPILQFYFPLNFLLMVFMSGLVSLQVAFKLGSILGSLCLPVTAYGLLRLLRCPFPGPGLGAALMLPVLFNSSHSMWGGNILSSLAGEFSYSLSMALSLLLIGVLYRGVRERRHVIRNAALVFLVGFSHGYTLLFAEAMSAFLLITPREFIRRCFYLGKVYVLAFCLLAFWIVPLLVFSRYTTPYHLVWTIHSWREIFPPLLLPSLTTGAVGTIGLLIAGIWKYRPTGREFLPVVGYLWFGLAMAVVFFVVAPKIGVVDVRYVPYGHVLGSLLAAVALGWGGWSLRKWKLDWVLLLLIVAATALWVSANPGSVAAWAKWNYEGFEAKPLWPVFDRINQALRGDFADPRVVFEHSELHNAFGSSRAFESLPLFAGRATLEGLYMQASISAPFVFFIQSEISQQKSAPFPQYAYGSMDFDRALAHLQLFNVGELIIRSDAAKRAIRQAEGYRLRETIGDYELWQVTSGTGAYVEPLRYEPVVFPTSDWKQDAYRWFRQPAALTTHLVFADEKVSAPLPPFRLLTTGLEDIPRIPVAAASCSVESRVGNQQIEIDTDCIGRPLLVKMSYHPDWHVEGAQKIWLVSPSFMLIYPDQNRVRLYYGPGRWDYLGRMLSLAALLVLLLNIPLPGTPRRTGWRLIADRLPLPAIRAPHFIPQSVIDPSSRTRWILLALAVLTLGVAVTSASWVIYHTNPDRVYRKAIELKDHARYAEARDGFRLASHEMGSSDQAQSAVYYIGQTYFLEKNDGEAIRAFSDLIRRFPEGHLVPESEYHIGLSLFRSGQGPAGIEKMRDLIARYPGTSWAEYARQRLQERGVTASGGGVMAGAGAITADTIDKQMGVAINHFNHDRLEQARVILAEISENFPDFAGAPQALAALALTYYKQGDCGGTERYYQDLVRRYPQDKLVSEAWYHLGVCAERSADTAAAREYFTRVVTEYPDTVYARQARERLGQ